MNRSPSSIRAAALLTFTMIVMWLYLMSRLWDETHGRRPRRGADQSRSTSAVLHLARLEVSSPDGIELMDPRSQRYRACKLWALWAKRGRNPSRSPGSVW